MASSMRRISSLGRVDSRISRTASRTIFWSSFRPVVLTNDFMTSPVNRGCSLLSRGPHGCRPWSS
ncbi:hypothetical protein ACFFX0_18890 [Citricoccus parietis]|uniref:Uncharacterized protein n=1 Tax=Citricoccus parietis TaxID=592307 RepID=A0ABV5G2K0_9MICC